MHGKKTEAGKYNKKCRQRFVSGLFVLAVILIFSIIANGSFAKAEDNIKTEGDGQKKYYKSILIEYGDTLWGIAEEYKDLHYESVRDYIDEVIRINNLKTDKIHAGRYLTIPYYKTCAPSGVEFESDSADDADEYNDNYSYNCSGNMESGIK